MKIYYREDESKIYTEKEAFKQIENVLSVRNKVPSGLLNISNLNVDLLISYGFLPIHICYEKYKPSIDDPAYPYLDFKLNDYSKIYFNPKTRFWSLDGDYVLNNLKIQEGWNEIRKVRDSLLAKYDWADVLPDDSVCVQYKKVVASYKSLLRHLPSLVKYPYQVSFPKEPPKYTVHYSIKEYSIKEVEDLFEQHCLSSEGITFWLNVGKPLQCDIVKSIINLYKEST